MTSPRAPRRAGTGLRALAAWAMLSVVQDNPMNANHDDRLTETSETLRKHDAAVLIGTGARNEDKARLVLRRRHNDQGVCMGLGQDEPVCRSQSIAVRASAWT